MPQDSLSHKIEDGFLIITVPPTFNGELVIVDGELVTVTTPTLREISAE